MLKYRVDIGYESFMFDDSYEAIQFARVAKGKVIKVLSDRETKVKITIIDMENEEE